MSSTSSSGRVYAAVAAGHSAEEMSRAIDACAPPGDERGRASAVNESGWGEDSEETALQAAHRLRRGDLVGLLLEEGADASKVFGYQRRPTTALALCVCYDLPETLRSLLRKGHDANQRLRYDWPVVGFPSASDSGCTLAHVCVIPPRLAAPDSPRPPPRLACLEALVREGGASVDARDRGGSTPLHWATRNRTADDVAAIDLLVRLGADVNARENKFGETPIFGSVKFCDPASLRRLLELGASPNLAANKGYTPLMRGLLVNDREFVLEVFRCLAPESRRAVVAHPGDDRDGFSTIDMIVHRPRPSCLSWQKELVAELLVSGASVLPRYAALVLPIAVTHLPLAAQKEAELSRRPAELCSSWPAHEAFSGLAMDVGELRAAESEVEAKRRRVMELEQGLTGSGIGMESSSSGGDDEGENESDDDESESDEDNESGSGSEDEEAGVVPSGGGGE